MTNQAKRNELSIALPKQERLRKPFNRVMDFAGLTYESAGPRMDRGTIVDTLSNDNAVIARAYELKPKDALNRLKEGVVDMAVVGFDMLTEFNAASSGADDFEYSPLPVSPCSMWIAGPAERPLNGWRDLNGLRIATKYEATLKRLLQENNVDAAVVPAEGGSEGTVEMGIADAICDMVDTGGTLKAYGLTKQFKVYDGSAVLVRRAGGAETPAMAAMREKLAATAPGAAQPREIVVPFVRSRAFA
jgi:ATP phosphoribosyltransferase